MLTTCRDALLCHPLLARLTTLQAWQTFMEHHVFAVWDFMSLLKRLQRELSCVEVVWLPRQRGRFARIVHEIVLAEESDLDETGGASSHFELYLRAMEACGANTTKINTFVTALRAGMPAAAALHQCGAPPCVRRFVEHTLCVAQHGYLEEVGATFFWGREDIIAEMFSAFVAKLPYDDHRFAPLRHYLSRHIELDGDSHGPLTQQLVEALCADDAERQRRAHLAATTALQARYQLWTGICEALEQQRAAGRTDIAASDLHLIPQNSN